MEPPDLDHDVHPSSRQRPSTATIITIAVVVVLILVLVGLHLAGATPSHGG